MVLFVKNRRHELPLVVDSGARGQTENRMGFNLLIGWQELTIT